LKNAWRSTVLILGAVAALAFGGSAYAAEAPACTGVQPDASTPLQSVSATDGCETTTVRGYPKPDLRCTPGAINPSLTLDVLTSAHFTTKCLRDKATSAKTKASTYSTYLLPHPEHNQGAYQTCELDHLVSLELGGADTLDNIWPQCGPSDVTLRERFFKQKDTVENYLAEQVDRGLIPLADAQSGIASDWTQYLDAATAWVVVHPHKRDRDTGMGTGRKSTSVPTKRHFPKAS
jgi:hypothetical protein